MQRFGFEVVPYEAERFPELRHIALFRERGIDVVIDIGANDGRWAEGLRDRGFRGRIVSFEPVSSTYRQLERRASGVPEWVTRHLALGDRAGTATIHVAGNSSSSSLLPMAARHMSSAPESAYVAEEEVELRRLDEVAPEMIRSGETAWLKVDAQGFELPILKGAELTLESVEVVEIELSLVELYEGQALIGDVIAFLTSRGFGARFIEPIFSDPASGEILQIDGIFTRRR